MYEFKEMSWLDLQRWKTIVVKKLRGVKDHSHLTLLATLFSFALEGCLSEADSPEENHSKEHILTSIL